ncbi:hypothetical protein [Undibacterium sp. Tian12W]|uniref:hypothetical protein n=1 Tax=Undibacterium sp. Tian12W TaxID=3413054 RepID=UPI003BF067F3
MALLERATERHLLHFDLARHLPARTSDPSDSSDSAVTDSNSKTLHAAAGPAPSFKLHVAMNEYDITPHTEQSLVEGRQKNGFLKMVPDEVVSHYAEVPLPSDAVALMWVTTPVIVDGYETERTISMGIHVPRDARLRDVRRKLLRANPDEALHPKLAYRQFGQNFLSAQLQALETTPDHIANYQDAYETAVALLFKHPELINLNQAATEGGPVTVIEACIRRALNEFNLLVLRILEHPDDWSTVERVYDGDQPAVDDEGKPVFAMGLHQDVLDAVSKALSRALVYASQAEELRGQTWSTQYGTTDAAYDGKVQPKHKLRAEKLRGANDVRWKLKNLTPTDGLVFEPDVRYQAAPAGSNWRAEGTWSSREDKPAYAFDEEAQKALADQNLFVVLDDMTGPLRALPNTPGHYAALVVSPSGRYAQVECMLMGGGTILQYLITSNGVGFGKSYFAVGKVDEAKKVFHFPVLSSGANGNLTIVVKNHWLRHLSCYVEFLDASGKAKAPENWSSRFPLLDSVFDGDTYKRYVGMVDPVETIMGIPLSADSSHFNVPVPHDAGTLRFTWGGLGCGANDPVACPPGVIMTVVIEMALPTMLLVAGAALTASGGMMKLLKQKPVYGALLAAFVGMYIGFADNPAKAAWTVGKKLLVVLAKAGLGQVTQIIAEMIATGAAKKAIPFINVALLLADIAATAAQLAQTTSAIRQSPRAHVTEVTRSIDLRITITSSKLYKKFPDHHHHLSVVIAYDNGATLPKLVKTLPPETISDDISVSFDGVPAAGNLRVLVFFYAENGWQSGQGASGWLKAEGSNGQAVLTVPPIEIDINEVPLGAWSVYEHQEKIVMQNGEHVWQAGPAPLATMKSPSSQHGIIEKLHSITMAQYPEMIGYAWKATDLHLPPDVASRPATNTSMYTTQNLSVLQHPQKAYATQHVGFTGGGGIGYDVVSPDDGSGRNFLIDPSRGVYHETNNPDGGFHLRRVALQYGRAPEFNATANQSWGRFPDSIDQMVVHPHGYVFGISRSIHKIFRIRLSAQAGSDSGAPLATLISGEGKRHGLIKTPVAVALAVDGRVLVLESGNARVQCFDVNGNPVNYFSNPEGKALAKVPVMALRPGKLNLLDMAVEAKGHIFILGHTGSGAKPEDYRMDLYDPAGVFLASTGNFTAARITVDLLRNLFALNYEVLAGKDGRPEPGISHWRPPAAPQH